MLALFCSLSALDSVIDGDKMVGALDLQDLHFIYDDVPEYAKKLRTRPADYLETPSFPGGLFAISRTVLISSLTCSSCISLPCSSTGILGVAMILKWDFGEQRI